MFGKRDIPILAVFCAIAAAAAMVTFLLSSQSPSGLAAPPASTQIAAPPAVAGQADTVADVAPLRTAPSVDAEPLGALPWGTVVTVLGVSPDGEWFLVEITDDQGNVGQAWVSAQFVAFDDSTEAAAPTATPSPVPEVAMRSSEDGGSRSGGGEAQSAPLSPDTPTPTPKPVPLRGRITTPGTFPLPDLDILPFPLPTIMPFELPQIGPLQVEPLTADPIPGAAVPGVAPVEEKSLALPPTTTPTPRFKTLPVEATLVPVASPTPTKPPVLLPTATPTPRPKIKLTPRLVVTVKPVRTLVRPRLPPATPTATPRPKIKLTPKLVVTVKPLLPPVATVPLALPTVQLPQP